MSPRDDNGQLRFRISIRGMITLICVMAVVLAWLGNEMRLDALIRNYRRQAEYAMAELRRAQVELAQSQRAKRVDRSRPFWEMDLEGTKLAGMTLKIPANSFQRASFRKCDLRKATLEGGAAAFQLAKFDGARLSEAILTGGGASFQASTFVGADLSGAVLSGGSTSFQTASFESANLTGAKLSGSFQSANIDSARFEGADLSAIASQDLASCIFSNPPTYDDKTLFPQGFDPANNEWRQVDRSSKPAEDLNASPGSGGIGFTEKSKSNEVDPK